MHILPSFLSWTTTFLAIAVVVVQSSSSSPSRKIVVGVDGGTESIRACCFDAINGAVIGESCAVSYPTWHPSPGWAEQDPETWYEKLGAAVRGALDSVKKSNDDNTAEVCAIALDTTCCSVVALDRDKRVLRPCLLWMDSRSAPQTEKILRLCKGDPALNVNCGGEGPLSAEWLIPKALWIKETEPDVWDKAETICEYQDFLNYRLTGVMCASSCNAAARWHFDGNACIKDDPEKGRPISVFKAIGIPELADKLPQKCLPMGSVVGKLTAEAAEHLNLPVDLPVVQGGPDAFVGMIGLGCVNVGQLCLITGSSHLHCVVSSNPTTARGIWGAYAGAPLPGINFAEGGQSSTGSILRWLKALVSDEGSSYKVLDDEAAAIEPGCDGLVALETFQGARTPVTDPLARGALVGLTLSHTRAHIWRAFMEAVCMGTRACIEGLANAGHTCKEIIIAGGSTRSSLWLQMHADVTGKPVVVCENADAPLLGCAVLASVGAGIHASVTEAVEHMVRPIKRVEPKSSTAAKYSVLYSEVYTKMRPSVSSIVHSITTLRGGEGGEHNVKFKKEQCSAKANTSQGIIISPSILASDWCKLGSEMQKCIDAGAPHIHVDVFDGVCLDSPMAFTFGPPMITAIRRTFPSSDVFLDLHMCVDRPRRFVKPMAEAGATRFIFMWETIEKIEGKSHTNSALELARSIVDSGMQCGVSINPETPVEVLYPLLRTGLVDVVDILAVHPGFGGQQFQMDCLEKVSRLARLKDSSNLRNLSIMVDGGINKNTALKAASSGADILVSGSSLFGHAEGLLAALSDIREKLTSP